MAKKTTCPINRAQFRSKARPVTVTINNIPLQAEVKEFSTGSLGWYLNGKTTVDFVDEKNTHTKGHFAFQQHNLGSEVWIRNVRVKELPAK